MSLLPLRGEARADPDEPQVLGLAGEEADEAFDVLASATTRQVLSHIYEQPATPAEIRDEIGTSLQNVHYHLDKLEDADLIEAAGTGYSEKGTEMTIYAPSNEAVVLFAGHETDRSRLRGLLGRVFGVLLAIAVAAVIYGRLLADQVSQQVGQTGGNDGESLRSSDAANGAGDGGGEAGAANATTTESGNESVGILSEPTATETETTTTATPDPTTTETATTVAGTDTTTPIEVVSAALSDPTIAFLIGGVFALAVATAVVYLTR